MSTAGLTLVVALLVAWATIFLLRLAAPRLGLLDLPNERSSHREPRPRGGGIGILAGALAGLGVEAARGATLAGPATVVLAGIAVVAAVGVWDDVWKLPPWPRLLVQTAVAITAVIALGAVPRLPLPAPLDVRLGIAAAPLTVLWLVGVTNFFNFMDGIDGLAGGQALVTLALALWVLGAGPGALLVLPFAGATAGFLVHNWPPARVFLGDVGSGALGFLLAALPLLAAPSRRAPALLAIALSLAFFLLDPVHCLFRRWRRGAPLGAAHRERAYQRLALAYGHAKTTGGLLLAALALSALAGLAVARPALGWPAIAAAGAAFAAEAALARRAGGANMSQRSAPTA